MRPVLRVLILAGLMASRASAATAPTQQFRYSYHLPASLDQGIAVALGSDGDVFATGRISNGCGGKADIYVARFDPSLNRKWEIVTDISGCTDNLPTGLAVVGDNAYVCGVGASGSTDGFILKVNADGSIGWTLTSTGLANGYQSISVDASDGSLWGVGSYCMPPCVGFGLHLRDSGATPSILPGIGGGPGTIAGSMGYGISVGPGFVDLAGGATDSSGAENAFVSSGLTGSGAGGSLVSFVNAQSPANFCKSISSFANSEAYLLVSGVTPGCQVTLMKLTMNADQSAFTLDSQVKVHDSGSGLTSDRGQVLVHPSLPLVVVADGPVLNAYDPSLDSLWQASVSGIPGPTFHGVAVADGLPLRIYAALEAPASGGSEIDLVRFDGPDPLSKKGQLIIAPNVVEQTGVRPYVMLLLSGSPGGTVNVRIFDVGGRQAAALTVPLDGSGRAEQRWDVGPNATTRILPGTYWALASGGGVNDKKPFAVTAKTP